MPMPHGSDSLVNGVDFDALKTNSKTHTKELFLACASYSEIWGFVLAADEVHTADVGLRRFWVQPCHHGVNEERAEPSLVQHVRQHCKKHTEGRILQGCVLYIDFTLSNPQFLARKDDTQQKYVNAALFFT